MKLKLLIEGGDMKPGPAIAQQLGPMGINIGKVISRINEETKNFKGMKVPVELDINEKTKDFSINALSPPTSELLKKELNIEKGTNDHKNLKVGNASIEDIIKITKIKYSNMLEKEFKSAVKSVLGTCTSLGILVENSEPKEIIKEIIAGKFNKEINEQKTEASAEKKEKLKEFFSGIKKAQEIRLENEKKAAEEKAEAKEEEIAAKPPAGKETTKKEPVKKESVKKA